MLADQIGAFLVACRARGLSANTIDAYNYNLTNLQRFLFEHNVTDLRDVTATHLRTFLAELRETPATLPFSKKAKGPRSPYTCDQAYRTINRLFNWYVNEGVLSISPMLHVEKPKVPKHKVGRLSVEQVQALFEAIRLHTERPRRNTALIALMIDSGLRLGEVVAIELDRLDLDNRKVMVRGKGDKDREIPLSPFTCDAIRAYMKERCFTNYQDRAGFHFHGEGRLFLSRKGKPLTDRAVYLMINKLRDHLGWKRLYPHLLRHSMAKLYLAGGGDLSTLQVILGHASITTTATFYLDPDFDDCKAKHDIASPLTNIFGNGNNNGHESDK